MPIPFWILHMRIRSTRAFSPVFVLAHHKMQMNTLFCVWSSVRNKKSVKWDSPLRHQSRISVHLPYLCVWFLRARDKLDGMLTCFVQLNVDGHACVLCMALVHQRSLPQMMCLSVLKSMYHCHLYFLCFCGAHRTSKMVGGGLGCFTKGKPKPMEYQREVEAPR